MASFSLEEFVGNGVLQDVLQMLVREGWDDVPTLKMMSAEDMEIHHLHHRQRDALEIRTYLHDRSLMQYADRLEASLKSLPELLNTSPSVLTSEYGMKRGHVARFIDRTTACGVVMPPSLTLPVRKRTLSSRSLDSSTNEYSYQAKNSASPIASPHHSAISPDRQSQTSSLLSSENTKSDLEGKKMKSSINDPSEFKGIVAAAPATPRLCGLIKPPPLIKDVTPLSALEKISVQRLTPEYKAGVDPWAYGELKVPPPMKACEIWASKPTLIFCIRRPGCVMCRAEAHQLYARKPIFDSLGIQLVAILHELISEEVKAFWPRFWGGMILVDKNLDFFTALGGGQLPKDGFITGFIFNPTARANFRRARATGIDYNINGNGNVKGGLFIMRPGTGGVAYQFVERNFGDWAPLAEVLDVCTKLRPQTGTIQEETPSQLF